MDAEYPDLVAAELLSSRPPSPVGIRQTQAIRTAHGDEHRSSHIVIPGCTDEAAEGEAALFVGQILRHLLDDAWSDEEALCVADQDQQRPTVASSLCHEEIEQVGDSVGTVDRVFVPVLGQLLEVHASRMHRLEIAGG
jgi:hypothetical protein